MFKISTRRAYIYIYIYVVRLLFRYEIRIRPSVLAVTHTLLIGTYGQVDVWTTNPFPIRTNLYFQLASYVVHTYPLLLDLWETAVNLRIWRADRSRTLFDACLINYLMNIRSHLIWFFFQTVSLQWIFLPNRKFIW
jgi:hypothetical protein